FTFTAADAGVHTFNVTLNTVGNRTVTVRQLGVSPAITGTTAPIQVHAAGATLIPVAGARELIVDATRQQLVVTTATGSVERYDLVSESLKSSWNVASSLYGGDITSDGAFLYLADGAANATQGIIRKVNL